MLFEGQEPVEKEAQVAPILLGFQGGVPREGGITEIERHMEEGSDSEEEEDDEEEAVNLGSETGPVTHPTPSAPPPSNTITLEDAISSLNRAAEFFLRRDVPADEHEAVNTLQFALDRVDAAVQGSAWAEVFQSLEDEDMVTPPGTRPPSPHTQATPHTRRRIRSPSIQFGRIPPFGRGESEDPLTSRPVGDTVHDHPHPMQVEDADDMYALEPAVGSWAENMDEMLGGEVVPPGAGFVDPTTTHP